MSTLANETTQLLALLSSLGPRELNRQAELHAHLATLPPTTWATLCQQHYGVEPHLDSDCALKYLAIWCLQHAEYYQKSGFADDRDPQRADFFSSFARHALVSFTHPQDRFWCLTKLSQYDLRSNNLEHQRAARAHLEEAAVAGHPDAQYALATDMDTSLSRQTRLNWLDQAAEQGHADALMYLAQLYDGKWDQEPLTPTKDIELALITVNKAMSAYGLAISRGDARAIEPYLGWRSHHDEERITLLRLAAENHFTPEVALQLAELHSRCDPNQAIEYLEQAALLGSVYANLKLAHHYCHTNPDANLYLHRAAKLSDRVSCTLGVRYLCGDRRYRINADATKADTLFHMAYEVAILYGRADEVILKILSAYQSHHPQPQNQCIYWCARGALQGFAMFAGLCQQHCNAFLAAEWGRIESRLAHGLLDQSLREEIFALEKVTSTYLQQQISSAQPISQR